ncbi:hypothetical protein GLYMA_01G095166v4 [Glycine max]|uniref:TF-B3 domain-containing protein n=2 Tax=Glycine subgen. Soja TaxID=1462606 RepID=A0A0R0JQR6_SOYBN|nr:hypothetical protein GLYMA_01G095166v4 [Glycine max]KAH1127081.1 hypothetical protein GYH30_015894 [Glycine max]RZC29231.1 B3 domain-containing transcription factor VRN1 [Glycine soja]
MHFFRIIIAPSLQEGKLMLPNKFVEKYGEGLPNTLFLKAPNGAEWKLTLEKRDDKMWFQKGWREFAKHHSLDHGHLLLFRYQRTSHFQVHIFDGSGLEIEYPLGKVEGKMTSNYQKNKRPNGEKLEYEFLQPCMGSRKCVKVDNTMKPKLGCSACASYRQKGQRKTKMTTTEHVTAFDRASYFRPCNPSFLVVIYPSNARSRGPLNFPSKFCKKHIDLRKNRGDINLEVLNGRVWHARYRIRTAETRRRFELSSGWKTFAEDNNLKVGDVCTFELIPATKLTFQVHIFRVSANSNCSTSQGSIDIF